VGRGHGDRRRIDVRFVGEPNTSHPTGVAPGFGVAFPPFNERMVPDEAVLRMSLIALGLRWLGRPL